MGWRACESQNNGLEQSLLVIHIVWGPGRILERPQDACPSASQQNTNLGTDMKGFGGYDVQIH